MSTLWHHRKKVFTPLHLNLHAGFPCNTFSHMNAVSAVWSHHLSLSCYLWHVRHTELLFRCPFVQLLMADMRMPAASCVLLFFHCEGRSCCWSEASRAEQSRREMKSHFHHSPSWHRFQTAFISLEYFSNPFTSPALSNIAWGPSTTIIILHLVFPPTWLD